MKGGIRPIRVRAALIVLSVAFGSVTASLVRVSAQDQMAGSGVGTMHSSKRMADGKEWTAANLDVDTSPSYCYDDAQRNCRRYGRLYTWESARRACQSLGDGWRLPTDDEWRQMATHYGGLGNDSADKGNASYTVLSSGGTSGFDAVLGGIRELDGTYSRLEAHGFYWTASENDPATAPFYNFGKGSSALYRQAAGEKQSAISARCVKD
ncbi:MAG TPA: FISUMP domain-containing protein [Vicinamibacterales bacterium]